MSNAEAYEALDAQIQRLRAVKLVAEEAAPKVAVRLKKIIDLQVLQGLGPDGKPWQRNADLSISLAGAARAITVEAHGKVIQVKVGFPFSFHNTGNTRGGIRRQIIPTNTLTAPLTQAIKEVIEEHIAEAVGGDDGK